MAGGHRSTNPVSAALSATRGAWFHVAVFSAAVNVLMLTGSIYMLQVYDRVLASRSMSTLLMISLITLAAFILQGVVDAARQKMLSRIGAEVDAQLSPLVARALVLYPLKGGRSADTLQPMRDLDALRMFLSSTGPTAMLDMPFMPLFLVACFVLHPWLGWLAVIGAILIVSMTWWTDHASRTPTLDLMRSGAERGALAEAGRRNAESIAAMGMFDAFARRFDRLHSRQVADGLVLADSSGGIGSAAKVLRFALQSAVLGLGAFLAIRGEVSAGAMIAASILTSRALAPIELAVANWRNFVAARQGYGRLKVGLPKIVPSDKSLTLPAPRKQLKIEDLAVVAPGAQRPIIQGVSFEALAGQAIGVIGPSGSGKSTLARALVAIWPAAHGGIRLDGALLDQWDNTQRGAFTGYLPQDVELFEGTIAENIARFSMDFSSEAVVAAATAAGAHGLITAFPEGYDTRLGDGGTALSGGQRQRIALARALYGEPFLVVLDEPNSSLDTEGDAALTKAIRSVKARKGIVVVVTHRPSGLAAVDHIAAMMNGRLKSFGARDEVLRQFMQKGPGRSPPEPRRDTVLPPSEPPAGEPHQPLLPPRKTKTEDTTGDV